MMRWLAAAMIAVVAATAGAPAATAAGLEQVMEGRFVARGYARLKPGWPAERLFCRLTGKTADAEARTLRVRCVTDAVRVAIRLELVVLKPGRRYRLTSFVPFAWLFGYDARYRYTGIAAGNRVDFKTDFLLDGQRYRSHFRILFGTAGVERIIETVRAEADGRKSVLVDLMVKRE